jgi:hypothetical protein
VRQYENDIVIEGGRVRRRNKPPKPNRDELGHTPLSADEELSLGRRPADHRHRRLWFATEVGFEFG